MKDGGPAFPYVAHTEPWDYAHGMSLRDWFAGQALADLAGLEEPEPCEIIAKIAYKLADAMLAERVKEKGTP